MEQEDLQNYSADDFRDMFLKRRARSDRKIFKKGSIEAEDIMANEYIDVCAEAAGGDIVCQDLLSYWFKRGNQALPENIELSMKWLFLAAANGNKHSMSKLQLFLSYAYDTIVFSDMIEDIKDMFDVDEFNYTYILGELLCKEIVKELNYDALTLSQEKLINIPYNVESMQRFTMALNKAIPKVMEYLKDTITKYKIKKI